MALAVGSTPQPPARRRATRRDQSCLPPAVPASHVPKSSTLLSSTHIPNPRTASSSRWCSYGGFTPSFSTATKAAMSVPSVS